MHFVDVNLHCEVWTLSFLRDDDTSKALLLSQKLRFSGPHAPTPNPCKTSGIFPSGLSSLTLLRVVPRFVPQAPSNGSIIKMCEDKKANHNFPNNIGVKRSG
jgi:hypothetical protein